jgi:hypothetical protein
MGLDNSESEFVEAFVEGTKLALHFDGDVVALWARARDGEEAAVRELVDAYWVLAAVIGIRLRPRWLRPSDAAQEGVLVLMRLVEEGSSTIVQDLGTKIAESFGRLKEPNGNER